MNSVLLFSIMFGILFSSACTSLRQAWAVIPRNGRGSRWRTNLRGPDGSMLRTRASDARGVAVEVSRGGEWKSGNQP